MMNLGRNSFRYGDGVSCDKSCSQLVPESCWRAFLRLQPQGCSQAPLKHILKARGTITTQALRGILGGCRYMAENAALRESGSRTGVLGVFPSPSTWNLFRFSKTPEVRGVS